MRNISDLNFCTLGLVHCAPKWILEMTHFFDKKWEKTVNLQFFSFLFDIIYKKIPQNFMKIPQNFMKNSQTFMKNSQKFTCHVFPPLLIRKEDIWVISRIQFGAQWTRPRVQKFKSEMFLIN